MSILMSIKGEPVSVKVSSRVMPSKKRLGLTFMGSSKLESLED